MSDTVKRSRFEVYDKGWAYKGRIGIVTLGSNNEITYHKAARNDPHAYGGCKFLDGLPCDTMSEHYTGDKLVSLEDIESYLGNLYTEYFEEGHNEYS